MLVHESLFLMPSQEPLELHLKEMLGRNGPTVELQTGIYLMSDFNAPWELKEHYKEYPDFAQGEPVGDDGGWRNSYGVCDSVENILEVVPELAAPGRNFVVTLSLVERDLSNTGQGDGWRWDKWGPYIGKQDPQCDYLDDEPSIDKVYCYHIYEKVLHRHLHKEF